MNNKKIILLAGSGQSTNIIYNAINQKFGVSTVIIEAPESSKVYFKRRIKRLGILTVIGQILFLVSIPKLLRLLSKKRLNSILTDNKLNDTEIPQSKIKTVKSVNSKETIETIVSLQPDLIIVNGTRIISKKVLQSTKCKFINTHAGITPMYRGVHGTYWALVNDDLQNSGVTVHFVDEGIDTGNIIAQKQVIPHKKDNFTTYPMLQLSSGIILLLNAIENYFSNNINTLEEKGESKLYYHPTIWSYLYNRIVKNVK